MSPKMKLFLEVFGPIAVLCFAVLVTIRVVDAVSVTSNPCGECSGSGGWELEPNEFSKDQRPEWENCGACGGEGSHKVDTTNQFIMIFCVIMTVLGVGYHRLRKVTLGKLTVATDSDGKTQVIRRGTGDGGEVA